uniref:Uncharacterized protein n=1 Tax=Siphoviridae sp. ctXOZ1 TaxID=2823585 RepID=A0A8S5LB45_9CAUD|nr:MAG TPA: hypothetical protein [Siphoviridae sp. ctXOZ1]
MSKLGNKASFLQGALLVPNLVALAGAAFVVDGPIWVVVAARVSLAASVVLWAVAGAALIAAGLVGTKK